MSRLSSRLPGQCGLDAPRAEGETAGERLDWALDTLGMSGRDLAVALLVWSLAACVLGIAVGVSL